MIEDNGYDVAVQQEKYEALRDEVAIFSQSTGSPHTAAIAPGLVEDDLVAIPLSWYSGWAFGELGQNAFESYTNYCFESMNGLEWFNKNQDVQTVAIISFPGEYGGDGAAGAAKAAEALGLEVVFDGTGSGHAAFGRQPQPRPDGDHLPDRRRPTPTWCGPRSTRPRSAAIMGGAVSQGFTGPVVGQLADLQLQAARHRPGATARPVLHRLDVHRHVGHRRAGHGRRWSTR